MFSTDDDLGEDFYFSMLTERIIKRHGGTIHISSKEDEGTTVTMTLPVESKLPM